MKVVFHRSMAWRNVVSCGAFRLISAATSSRKQFRQCKCHGVCGHGLEFAPGRAKAAKNKCFFVIALTE
jgi:hypothetical protein